jgi:hypothetical protein
VIEKLADEFGVDQSKVSRFLACARNYAVPHNRPPFWKAYDEVSGKPKATLRGVSGPEKKPPITPCTVDDLRQLIDAGVQCGTILAAEAASLVSDGLGTRCTQSNTKVGAAEAASLVSDGLLQHAARGRMRGRRAVVRAADRRVAGAGEAGTAEEISDCDWRFTAPWRP